MQELKEVPEENSVLLRESLTSSLSKLLASDIASHEPAMDEGPAPAVDEGPAP